MAPETNESAPARPRKLVALHWLTALFVLLAATFILTRDEMDGRTVRLWLLEGHRHFGLIVLLLFFVRVALRIRLGKLPPTHQSHWMLRWAASLVHVALYAIVLLLPLLGWALSNAMDLPVHFLGLTLPTLVAADEDLADQLQAWHTDAAWILLALVCLHVLGALYHHFVVRDQVLRAMLPARRR